MRLHGGLADVELTADLRVGQPAGDEQIEVVWMPFGEALEAVLAGDITESVSVAGILKAAVLYFPRGTTPR